MTDLADRIASLPPDPVPARKVNGYYVYKGHQYAIESDADVRYWVDAYAYRDAQLSAALMALQDLRVNSTHPRHLQWRAECDQLIAACSPTSGENKP